MNSFSYANKKFKIHMYIHFRYGKLLTESSF